MGFHLISSNRVEQLTAELAMHLLQSPLSNPFEPEVLLVPSMPMKRWLGLQLAQIAGINCNNDYPLPAAWLWQLVSDHVVDAPKMDPLARDQATWKVFALLDNFIGDPRFDEPFEELNKYLENDNTGIKRWQLAERIADVFDRYQYYRPELIQTWSAGGGSDWQALLWRALITEAGSKQHRLALIETFMEKLDRGDVQGLPERISLFAVSSLPPLLLRLIQRVARFTDVYLYYLTPTDQYWADLKTEKTLAKIRLEKCEDADYYETGHELLASWGKQGQVFQDLLYADETFESLTSSPYICEWPDTLLGNLQRDLFEVQMPERVLPEYDHSLAVHICHSPMRECQVLHDVLLRQLNDDPDLKPEDILVMVPEISRYAPYIEAVFRQDESRPFLPWNLSDISVVDEHPVIGSFLQLLELPASRFTLSEILSLLDVPEIAERFDLDGDKLEVIRSKLAQLNVRWGIDGAHKEALHLPATIENSWKQAEERLMAGFAMGDVSMQGGGLWQGIAPFDIGGSDAAALADFWALFEQLKHWRAVLAEAGNHTAQAWQGTMTAMLESLFIDTQETGGRLQLIRDAIADLARHAGDNHLSRDLVCTWLKTRLNARDSAGNYFSGGVSFCGMRPMRSLPFRVICLLGMQDSAFPGRERRLEFDQMLNERPHPADPLTGVMDRYLMLETLLCARDAIHISYTGRSIKDNSECQPSVLIGELLDQLTGQYGDVLMKRITHEHPMQPFSTANYLYAESYDRYWCELANQVAANSFNRDGDGWPSEPVEIDQCSCATIDISRLSRFMRDPVKFFFNDTLSIYLNEHDEPEDEEPFTLDGLASWQVKKRMLDAWLGLAPADQARMQAEGMLPHGNLATQAYAEQAAAVAAYQPVLEAYQETRPQARMIELLIQVDDRHVQLIGQVRNYFPKRGLLHVTPSKLKSKYAMSFWIEHLTLCASGCLTSAEQSTLICSDTHICLQPLPADEAKLVLAGYLDAMFKGMQYPLPVFERSSWEQATSGKVRDLCWHGQEFQDIPGDKDDAYVRVIMRDVSESPVGTAAFTDWAERFYRPLLNAWPEGMK
ncbi:exodeoxyribonuclease V subunit gamma [Mariprofundus erugo]|uniref:RecBCD enzyme subunit RecC n=1 Tax=Mariprofundus erugo TaxID=2528639 RepID=A0A5R9GTR7_9PROT|nr:exodeoxyribonuclease V subunit gamma [Mariprofundus erugo]TLS67843.1 exodeoxyribonuclease V subunit gamma [Mariprofundus erugo]